MEQLKLFIRDQASFLALFEVTLIILATYIASLLLSRFLLKLKNKFKKSKTIWDNIIVDSIEKPLKLIVWLIGLTLVLDIFSTISGIHFLKFTPIVRTVGIILLLAWISVRIINSFEDNLIKGARNKNLNFDKFTADFMAKILKVVVLAIAGLITLESLGFSVSGIIALGGIGGAALAFASQNLLSNFFGTMTLYLDKPFAIGEYINIKDENIKGYVDEIGWRMTKLRTLEQIPIYVPNSIFTKSPIINMSRISNRKFFEKIGIKTDDMGLLNSTIEQISNLLTTSIDIDKTETLNIYFNDFGFEFIEIVVDAFINTTDTTKYHNIRHELMLNIFDIVHKNNLKIIFSNENKILLQR